MRTRLHMPKHAAPSGKCRPSRFHAHLFTLAINRAPLSAFALYMAGYARLKDRVAVIPAAVVRRCAPHNGSREAFGAVNESGVASCTLNRRDGSVTFKLKERFDVFDFNQACAFKYPDEFFKEDTPRGQEAQVS